MLEGVASVLLLLMVGVPGWLLLERLRVPAAPLIGSMGFVAILVSLGLAIPSPPAVFRPALQIVIGLFIGARVRRDTVGGLRQLALPAIVVSAWWLAASLALGFFIYRLTDLNALTAFLGSTAGGVVEVSLLAVSFDTDCTRVVMMQFLRSSATVVAVPLVRHKLSRASNPAVPVAEDQVAATMSRSPAEALTLSHMCACLLAGAGGLALHSAGVPAGGLIGAMIAVGGASLLGYQCPAFPEWSWVAARLGLGGIIGLGFTADAVVLLSGLVIPVLSLIALHFLSWIILSLVLARMTGWKMETCVVATSPGGLSQMAVIAADLGADPVAVTLIHLVRHISIIIVIPLLLIALSIM